MTLTDKDEYFGKYEHMQIMKICKIGKYAKLAKYKALKKHKMQMCKAKLREGVKKQIFYSQADRKHLIRYYFSSLDDLVNILGPIDSKY